MRSGSSTPDRPGYGDAYRYAVAVLIILDRQDETARPQRCVETDAAVIYATSHTTSRMIQRENDHLSDTMSSSVIINILIEK